MIESDWKISKNPESCQVWKTITVEKDPVIEIFKIKAIFLKSLLEYILSVKNACKQNNKINKIMVICLLKIRYIFKVK